MNAGVLALGVVLATGPAPAVPGLSEATEGARTVRPATEPDPAYARARDAFDAAAEHDDPATAIEAWQAAKREVAAIEDPAVRASVGDACVHNLVRARLRAFRADGDPKHLGASRRDVAAQAAGRDPMPPDLARLSDLIDAQTVATPAEPAVLGPPNRRLQLAGIVVAAGAAVPLAVMVGGLALGQRSEADYHAGPTREDRDGADTLGARGNAMAFGGGLTAGLMLALGAGLIGLARDRKGKVALRGPWVSGRF